MEQVVHVERLENKKSAESKVVEELLAKLDLQDTIITMDTLHCKKKR
jgi:predicted transposase YbfD/YdcC